MFNNDKPEGHLIRLFAERLKKARLAKNESQELFAQRLGLSRQSYGRMEKGVPSTAIGNWLAASRFLGKLDTWENVLAEQEDLFEQYDGENSARQRAGKRRKKK